MRLILIAFICFLHTNLASSQVQNTLATLPQNDSCVIGLVASNKVKLKRTYYQHTSTEPKMLSQVEYFDPTGRVTRIEVYNPKGDTVIVDSFFYNKSGLLVKSKSTRKNGMFDVREYEYLPNTVFTKSMIGYTLQAGVKLPVEETFQFDENGLLVSGTYKDMRKEETWKIESQADSVFSKISEVVRKTPATASPVMESFNETYKADPKIGKVIEMAQYFASKKTSGESTVYNSSCQVAQRYTQYGRSKGNLAMMTYNKKGLPEAESHSSGAYITFTYAHY